MRTLGLTFSLATVLAFGIGCATRDGGGERRDSGPRMDSGMGATDSGPGVDTGIPPRDSGPGRDSGMPPRDGGGSVSPGSCDPTCLSMSGAACCQTCGCGGATVRCEPRCPAGYMWDCEFMCCFDYEILECLTP